MNRTRIATLLVAACLLAPLSARAQALPADIAASKTVRVALNADYPPLELRDAKTNELAGFDIELGNAMAKVLGVKLDWQDGAFEQMTPSLQSGRADMIMSGFYDLPKRRGNFDFIDYLRAGAQFYVPKANTEIKAATDICGQTVTTSRGTNFPDTTKAWSDKNCVAAGKPPLTVITDTDLGQQLSNLKQGRAIAAVQGLEAVPTIVAMDGDAYRPLGEPFSSTLMGIAFTKADPTLRDAFVFALKQVIADGTYAALIKKWKLDLSAYTKVTLNEGPAP
ncbi:MAG TPA: ABC transporter substrate-binding protein [Bradyrhizobium sp.]